MDDLALLLSAIVAFSLFFASLAHAYVAFAERAADAELEAAAGDLLEAVLTDPRWTEGRGAFLAEALDAHSDADLRASAAGRPFRVVVWDVGSDARWSFGGGSTGDGWRTADTAGTVRGGGVRPARITATVWAP